jgi:hypothetical protein
MEYTSNVFVYLILGLTITLFIELYNYYTAQNPLRHLYFSLYNPKTLGQSRSRLHGVITVMKKEKKQY